MSELRDELDAPNRERERHRLLEERPAEPTGEATAAPERRGGDLPAVF
jgi:hypothetical protein